MQEVYVVFDGPPGPEAGRFVEVETKEQESVGGIPWEKFNSATFGHEDDGFWRLGPLVMLDEEDKVLLKRLRELLDS